MSSLPLRPGLARAIAASFFGAFVVSNQIVQAYESALTARGYQADAAQRRAIARLQKLADELANHSPGTSSSKAGTTASASATPHKSPLSWLAGWSKRLAGINGSDKAPVTPSASTPPLKSVYFWGGVGRGKTFVMDVFFSALAYPFKRRMHFHAFMQEVHERLRWLREQQTVDPLNTVAEELVRQARLFCFDEFHVSDIADAMILGRLLEALWARGAVFVFTSNYHPDGLYPNGLMRINFLPTIERLKAMCDVIELDDGADYRLRTLETLELFLVPADAAADAKLRENFLRLTGEEPVPGEIVVQYRRLPVRGNAHGVLWCDFAALCASARAQSDYLAIANEYHTLILSHIPRLGPAQAEAARRLTWLIDILYDHRVKLIASAEAPPYELYLEGPNAHEFPRTVSRLMEMRSRAYLQEPHRLSAAPVPSEREWTANGGAD